MRFISLNTNQSIYSRTNLPSFADSHIKSVLKRFLHCRQNKKMNNNNYLSVAEHAMFADFMKREDFYYPDLKFLFEEFRVEQSKLGPNSLIAFEDRDNAVKLMKFLHLILFADERMDTFLLAINLFDQFIVATKIERQYMEFVAIACYSINFEFCNHRSMTLNELKFLLAASGYENRITDLANMRNKIRPTLARSYYTRVQLLQALSVVIAIASVQPPRLISNTPTSSSSTAAATSSDATPSASPPPFCVAASQVTTPTNCSFPLFPTLPQSWHLSFYAGSDPRFLHLAIMLAHYSRICMYSLSVQALAILRLITGLASVDTLIRDEDDYEEDDDEEECAENNAAGGGARRRAATEKGGKPDWIAFTEGHSTRIEYCVSETKVAQLIQLTNRTPKYVDRCGKLILRCFSHYHFPAPSMISYVTEKPPPPPRSRRALEAAANTNSNRTSRRKMRSLSAAAAPPSRAARNGNATSSLNRRSSMSQCEDSENTNSRMKKKSRSSSNQSIYFTYSSGDASNSPSTSTSSSRRKLSSQQFTKSIMQQAANALTRMGKIEEHDEEQQEEELEIEEAEGEDYPEMEQARCAENELPAVIALHDCVIEDEAALLATEEATKMRESDEEKSEKVNQKMVEEEEEKKKSNKESEGEELRNKKQCHPARNHQDLMSCDQDLALLLKRATSNSTASKRQRRKNRYKKRSKKANSSSSVGVCANVSSKLEGDLNNERAETLNDNDVIKKKKVVSLAANATEAKDARQQQDEEEDSVDSAVSFPSKTPSTDENEEETEKQSSSTATGASDSNKKNKNNNHIDNDNKKTKKTSNNAVAFVHSISDCVTAATTSDKSGMRMDDSKC